MNVYLQESHNNNYIYQCLEYNLAVATHENINLPSQVDVVGVINSSNELSVVGNGKDRYRFASVTKLIATHVIADAVASKFIGFDDQIISERFKEYVSLADLMSHCSGIKTENETIPPRTKRIYSNLAFDLAEKHLITSLGKGFENESIGTLFRDGLNVDLGTSIEINGSCASSATGTFDDLIIFLNEIRSPQYIEKEIHNEIASTHNPLLPGILPGWGYSKDNTWGIGYEVKGEKSPHWMGSIASPTSYGHFGMSGSFIFHDPVNNISIAGLSNVDFGPWAKDVWPLLCDSLFEL